MDGIPVHTHSPTTTAAKASGVTPKTATAPIQSSQQTPSSNTATSTSTATPESSYPFARPGAAPAPAPTGSVHGRAPGPSPTKTTSGGEAPPPQPGAAPVPFPPAIRPEDAYTHQLAQHQTSPTAALQSYLPQTSLPPPTTRANYPAQPPSSTTVTATTSPQSFNSPVSLPQSYAPKRTEPEIHSSGDTLRRRSIGRPSGYVQNQYAAEPPPSRQEYGSSEQGVWSGEEGVWDMAKRWARVAGEKVGEVENEIWKRINK